MDKTQTITITVGTDSEGAARQYTVPRGLLTDAGITGTVLDADGRRRLMILCIEQITIRSSSVCLAEITTTYRDERRGEYVANLDLAKILERWLSYCSRQYHEPKGAPYADPSVLENPTDPQTDLVETGDPGGVQASPPGPVPGPSPEHDAEPSGSSEA